MRRSLPAVLLPLLAGCAALPAEVPPPPEKTTGVVPPPAYAAYARKRQIHLKEMLRSILAMTRPEIAAVRAELSAAVGTMSPPPHFSTNQLDLKRWYDVEREEYATRVTDLYGEARERLVTLYEVALDRAQERALTLASRRSPLDAGRTGDPLLDRQLLAFEETLRGAVNLPDLDASERVDLRRGVRAVEVFTSFDEPGADEALGGRLMLFVGGEEASPRPFCRLVLRAAQGVDPTSRGVFQVMRHRIMRGDTIVQDLGWRAMPDGTGLPEVSVEKGYLFASNISPELLTDEPSFEQLADMRVVVDVQTAIHDRGADVLGGVNWRIEFRVTRRGDVTWQLAGARPFFDPDCEEAQRVISSIGDDLVGVR